MKICRTPCGSHGDLNFPVGNPLTSIFQFQFNEIENYRRNFIRRASLQKPRGRTISLVELSELRNLVTKNIGYFLLQADETKNTRYYKFKLSYNQYKSTLKNSSLLILVTRDVSCFARILILTE